MLPIGPPRRSIHCSGTRDADGLVATTMLELPALERDRAGVVGGVHIGDRSLSCRAARQNAPLQGHRGTLGPCRRRRDLVLLNARWARPRA